MSLISILVPTYLLITHNQTFISSLSECTDFNFASVSVSKIPIRIMNLSKVALVVLIYKLRMANLCKFSISIDLKTF